MNQSLLKYAVGIDVSKDKFDVCMSVIDTHQRVTIKATRGFSNSPKLGGLFSKELGVEFFSASVSCGLSPQKPSLPKKIGVLGFFVLDEKTINTTCAVVGIPNPWLGVLARTKLKNRYNKINKNNK